MSHVVRLALPRDLEALPNVEAAADRVFATLGIGPLPPGSTSVDELASAQAVLVVGDPAVGFARVETIDGQAHLEQLSVHPAAARRGVGTALVEAVSEWAMRSGFEAVTLCTFAEVPWNAPFYRRLGFVPLTDLGAGLLALREQERRVGLDRFGPRVVMRRRVAPPAA